MNISDHAGPIGVREQQVVPLGQETDGCRLFGVRPRSIDEIKELAPALVAERAQLRPQPFDDGGQCQAAPRLRVGGRGGTERRKIP